MVRCGADRVGQHACARPLDRGDRATSAPRSPRGPGQSCGGGPGLPCVCPPRLRYHSPGSRAAGSEPEWTARRWGDGWRPPFGWRRRRCAAWTITRPAQTTRMGVSPTAPTISQDSAHDMLLSAGAIAWCDTNVKCPRMAGGGITTSKFARRGDRRAGYNSWQAGEAPHALLPTEFGGRGLELASQPAVIVAVGRARDGLDRRRCRAFIFHSRLMSENRRNVN
jgi:hypothetical protein